MLGRTSEQKSFFDASLAVEEMLELGSFYEVLYRRGWQLVSDEDFADCYDVTTGRPSVPPSRMFKLLLLQIYEKLTDRQTLERMAFDLRWKAVLGLEVGDRPVAQSTLVEFRARLQLHEKMEEVFERFLVHAADVGLIAPDEVQVVDSSAIWGRGAVEDTYQLIGSAVRKLLGVTARGRGATTEDVAGQVGLILTMPTETGSLKGRAGIDWSSPEERRAFLNEVVQEARMLLREVSADEAENSEVAEAAALLRRVVLQDLEPMEQAADSGTATGSDDLDQGVLSLDTEVKIRQGVARDRTVSTGDPEMRHGHKSRNRMWNGYKAHVSVTAESEFITAVHVTPANVHDGAVACELIEAQERLGFSPSAVVGDMAYSAAELRQWAEAMGTEMVARVPPASARADCFSKVDFTIDLEARTVTCPAGQTARIGSLQPSRGSTVHFDGLACADCPLREACTQRDREVMRRTGRGRHITIHPREAVLQRARAAEATERVQELLKQRPVVERRLAHLMGRGLRQARYVGTLKTGFQALATALVTNLVRYGALHPRPQRRSAAPLPSHSATIVSLATLLRMLRSMATQITRHTGPRAPVHLIESLSPEPAFRSAS